MGDLLKGIGNILGLRDPNDEAREAAEAAAREAEEMAEEETEQRQSLQRAALADQPTLFDLLRSARGR